MVRVPFHEMTTAKVMLLFGSLGYIQPHCAGMKMASVPRLNYTIHNKNYNRWGNTCNVFLMSSKFTNSCRAIHVVHVRVSCRLQKKPTSYMYWEGLGTKLGRSDHNMTMTSRVLGAWRALVEQGRGYSMDFETVQPCC